MVIAVAGPTADFAVHVDELLRRVLPLTVAIMLATLLATVLLSRLIAGRLAGLMRSVDAVRQLDFAAPPPPRSAILELDLLGQAMALMQQAIGKRTAELEQAQSRLRTLVELGIAMGAERDVPKLAGMALEGAVHIAGASGGALFLRHGEAQLREVGGDAEIDLASDDPLARALRERRPVAAGAQVAVPLRPLGGEVIGAMRLATAALPPEEEGFVEALAASAAAALDNRRLLEARDALLDALISLIAGAIDAKSPYTGGHCRRVPELAVMLAEAADGAEAGPLAPFRFAGPEEWREFRVAAWLHDCGKVATPEYVVDKATKLETLYNRIHEIRTRFEVLWRDAEIASLRRRLNGTSAMAEAAWLDTTLAELRDDYAFVAGCNLGAESMSAADLGRLAAIAERSWQRHFSDRLGLSMAEQQRLAPIPEPSLPAAARLLEDRPDHVVPRDPAAFALHATLKFALPVPRNQFDFGELRNLSIRHGTLTEEERFIINEHVLHSIAMLESLPLPKELRRVPEFAGTHHETLDGTGYPRRLGAAQLAVPSRIMAIADIFEALTASDRPYRPAKRLSEALAILQGMVGRGKLDADLYALFLAGGVCRRYAERFLRPEQIDLDLATLGLA